MYIVSALVVLKLGERIRKCTLFLLGADVINAPVSNLAVAPLYCLGSHEPGEQTENAHHFCPVVDMDKVPMRSWAVALQFYRRKLE